MKNDRKTKSELIEELKSVRRKVKRLESQLKKCKHTEQNITERKKAEEALKLFGHAIKSSNECISITDIENNILYLNQTFLDTYGYTENELLGKSIYLVRAHLQFSSDEILLKTLHGGWQGELLNRKKDGTIFPVSLSTSVVYDENKQAVALVGIALDITKRKQTEQSLRESEERFRSLFENSTVGIYRTTPEGKILLANPTLVKILDYSSFEELATRNLQEVGFTPPYDRSPFLTKIESEGEIRDFESSWIRRNGERIFIRESARAIRDSQGRTLYYDGIVENITERKQAEETLRESEERFHRLFEASPEAIMLLDPADPTVDWPIVDCNEIACQMNGYTRKELIGKSIDILNISVGTPEERITYLERLRREDVIHFETFHRHHDGHIFPIEVSTSIVTFEGRELILGIDRDITERKQVEEVIRESEERFRMVFENVFDGISIYSEDPDPFKRRLVECNERYAAMAGRNREELLQLGSTQGLQITLEDMANNNRLQSLTRGTSFHGSFSWIRPDGKENIIEYVGMPITWRGKSYSIGIDRDITERKRAEEALRETEKNYRLLFEQNLAGVYHTTLEGEILDCNNAFVDMFGYSSREELRVHNAADLYFGAIARDNFISRLKSQGFIKNSEITLRRKDGTTLFGLENATLLTVEKHSPSYTILGTIIDITERKRAEEALTYERNLLRALMDNVPDNIYFKDTDSHFIAISKALAEKFNLSDRVQAIGKTDFNFFTEEHARPAFENEQEIIKTGRPLVNLEEKETWPDGRETWVSTTKVPLRDIAGQIVGTFGISRDITERKLSEQALQRSEEKLRDLFENAPVGYHELDEHGYIMNVNQRELEMLGYTREEMIGWPIWGFVTNTEYSQQRVLAKLADSLPPNKNVEQGFLRKDGTLLPVLVDDVFFRNKSGKITGIRSTILDITERKKMEEALRQSNAFNTLLVQTMPFGIDIVDEQGNILFLNETMEKLVGAESLGQRCWMAYKDDKQQCQNCPLKKRIEFGTPEVIESTGVFGGKTYQISHIGMMYEDKKAMLEVFQDITEQKKLQNQFLQTQKVQSIGTLAGGIAHDFNNILGIILAFTSVLERSEGNKEKVSKSTTAITQAVSRGAALVHQILTFARQTGILMKPMSIPELIRELQTMLKETFPEVIEFQTSVEKNIPFVNADHTQMHQVLLNLCVNARDAMPKGGILSIEAKTVPLETLIQQFPEADSDKYVAIRVSDTGIGMDEATRSRIFDPFFTTKELGQGTGLGLSVVYGVIQEHHGFISVESTVGRGTTFSLYLPIPQEEKKTQEIKNIRIEELEGGSETILFAEDEELLREVVQSILESNGYKVLIATDGREAVEIYKKNFKNISLVLTDIGLPKLTGIDAYAMIKEVNPDVKVIFASGFISLDTRSELLKEGVKGFIQKPYSISEVLQIVREVLNENE